MCGFTGYFETKSNGDGHQINEMLMLQKHRGPDDSGFAAVDFEKSEIFEYRDHKSIEGLSKGALIIGFNRLSILDVSENGHQPMLNEENDVVFMMNGEVYNAFDYKEELENLGYTFKGGSDSEVVFKLYLQYGIQGMLERLNGMFAIFIHDSRENKSYLVRDRFGIKPLYVLDRKGGLAFSSEIKSFKALSDFSFELDENQLHEFLLFRNVINKTLFKNIRNIDPGTYLEIDSKGEIREFRFHQIDHLKEGNLRNKEAKEFLEQALEEGVNRQMISDVKLGCQLSGGVDSSLVTSFASNVLKEGQLESVSIVFDDERFSEKDYIDQVTSKLDIQSHQYKLSKKFYINHLRKATWHFEQPLNHPNTIGIYLLSQEAKKDLTVLLSGEGADEILAGYSRFKSLLNSPFNFKTIASFLSRNNWSFGLLFRAIFNAENRLILSSSFGSPYGAKKLWKRFDLKEALKQRKRIYRQLSGNALTRHRKYEIVTYIPDLLMRQDKMSMAQSIENRVPFLDNEVVEAVFQIDSSELIKNGQAKNILKEICAERFNHEFAYRKKMGFSIPLNEFLSDSVFLKDWNQSLLPSIEKRGIFKLPFKQLNKQTVSKMNQKQVENLWMVASFEIWAQEYLD